MSQTVQITGSLKFPLGDDGVSVPSPLDLAFSKIFKELANVVLSYDGPVSDSVISLGTLSTNGAKGIFIKCLIGSCSYKFNNDTNAKPMTIGGYTLIVNPVQGWLTDLKITTAAAAQVQIIAFG